MTATSSNPARECQPGTASLWQPIDSAPKDGTDIIVYRPKFDKNYIPQVGIDYFSERLGNVWAKSRRDTQPTHWQALPPPPEAI